MLRRSSPSSSPRATARRQPQPLHRQPHSRQRRARLNRLLRCPEARAMRTRPRLSVRVAICAALAALPPFAFGQSSGDKVAVDTKAGYARILFTFEEAAPVKAAIADGVLTVELKRPVDTTME